MVFLVVHVFIIVFVAWKMKQRFSQYSPGVYWSAFGFKIICGWLVGLLYTHYYQANDTWLFFHDATQLADVSKTNVWHYIKILTGIDSETVLTTTIPNGDRSFLIIRLTSFFCLISSNNYWACAAYFSFFSFIASWFLFMEVSRYFDQSNVAASFAFLFFPSIIFWSSGIVKETLALGGIYFLVMIFLRVTRTQKISWRELLLGGLSVYLAWGLKYYWVAILLIVFVTALLHRLVTDKSKWARRFKVTSWVLLFLMLTVAISFIHPNFHLSGVMDVIVSNHNEFLKISKPYGVIHYFQLEPSFASLFLNSPLALASGLFRPFIWEAHGLMAIIASLENFILLVLFISALPGLRGFPSSSKRLLILSVAIYIGLLCMFLALSTPNFGTLSRYRVGFLPFFVFLISYQNPLVNFVTARFGGLKR